MIDTAADCFALMLEAGSQADCTCCAISLEEAVTLPSRWRHRRGVWRSLAVEKLSQIELRTEAWYIKPRFKRQTCIGEIDLDVDLQPGDDPQKGQCGNCRSNQRARTMRMVAMECGL